MPLVKINLRDILGSGFVAPVVFTPTETPWIEGDHGLVMTAPRIVTTSDEGIAETDLKPGSYRVTFAGRAHDVLTIGVPDDDGEYPLTVLISEGTTIPNPPDWTGPKGDAATIEVGSVETLEPGEPVAVVNRGTSTAAIFDFSIPAGAKGEAATVDVGTVTSVDPDQPAKVVNSGTSTSAVFNFEIPKGDPGIDGNAATVVVVSTDTGAPGTPASVVNEGNEHDAKLAFTIPRGNPGEAATINVGAVATGSPGSNVVVTNEGNEYAAVFNFTIPRGNPGEAASIEVGAVNTGAPGSNALVTNAGTDQAVVLDFEIPRGDPGQDAPRRTHAALVDGVIPLSFDGIYYTTLTGATDFTFADVEDGTLVLIWITNSGEYAATWPVGIEWMDNVPPPSILPAKSYANFMVFDGVVTGGWI